MSKLKIGIIGETGQLAKALIKLCDSQSIEAVTAARQDLDLSADDTTIISWLSRYEDVHCVVNAAAYTAVDKAESDEETAYRVNANAPGLISAYCKRRDIPLVHISTDYVFNGAAKDPYLPDHPTNPLGVYGATKLQGEELLRQQGAYHAILRTSWVYDGEGKNFLTTMLRLGETRETMKVVCDQFGRPTYAKHLAEACLIAAKALIRAPDNYTGTYHVSNTGSIISWADFASAIFEGASEHLPHSINVEGIPSIEYPTPARRPAFSAMDVSTFESVFEHKLPLWSVGLEQGLDEWIAQKKGDESGT